MDITLLVQTCVSKVRIHGQICSHSSERNSAAIAKKK